MSDNSIEEQALAILNAQHELEQSEIFKQFLLQQQHINQMKDELKKRIKEEMKKPDCPKKIHLESGEDVIDISLSSVRPKLEVSNVNEIPDEFLIPYSEDELIERDGQIFKKIDESEILAIRDSGIFKELNEDLAKNYLKLGLDLPEGIKQVSQTSRLSIKLNGKAI